MAGGMSVSGLASGLDTDAIVAQLLAIERRPQIRLKQQEVIERARKQVLTDVQTRLQNLSTAISGLRDTSTWGDVQTVDSSDSAKVTVARTGGAASGAYSLSVSQLARAAQQTQQTSATSASADGTLTFQVGTGSTITVDLTSGDSLDTIASKINGSSDIPVYASVSGGKLVVSGKTTGAANTVTIGGTLAGDFGFAETLAPQDAVYSVNGGPDKQSASNTVTDGIVGLSLTLKATTSSPVTITVGTPGPDTAAITKKIKDFVEQYNSTVDFIKGKLEEDRVVKPKSDADREKGVLKGDPALSGLLTNLRNAVSDVVVGRPVEMSYASQAGLSTGATTGDGTLNEDAISGKLTIDTTKLSDQLASRFSDVKAVFTNVTGSYDTEGIAQRLDALVNAQISGDGTNPGILDSRLDSEQSMIDGLIDRQGEWDVRLGRKEEQLRKQFAALEAALAKVHSDNGWIGASLARL